MQGKVYETEEFKDLTKHTRKKASESSILHIRKNTQWQPCECLLLSTTGASSNIEHPARINRDGVCRRHSATLLAASQSKTLSAVVHSELWHRAYRAISFLA